MPRRPSSAPAAAQKRLPWFHDDLRRRRARFDARLAEIERNDCLVARARNACESLAGFERAVEFSSAFGTTAAGRAARSDVERALAWFRLPADLAPWLAWFAVKGESDIMLLAGDYREDRIGPHARHVREPVTREEYLEIRVPAEWSDKAIVAALPYLRSPTIFPGVEPPPTDGGGRHAAVTLEEALDLARRFDAEIARTLGGRRLAVKVWLAQWDRWLARALRGRRMVRASSLWRTSVKSAVEVGLLLPSALDLGRVRRARGTG